MNLTQKDKITLSILVIVLSLFLGLWFVLRPAWNDIQDNKKKYNDLKSQYTSLEKQLEEKAKIKENVQKKYDECVELASMFYSDEQDREIADKVYQQLTDVGITVTSQTFSHTTKALAPYRYRKTELSIPSNDYADINPDDGTEAQAAEIKQETVGCYTFNISFTNADKDKIFKFVENLTTYDHTTMVVTSLSFEVSDMDKTDGSVGNIDTDDDEDSVENVTTGDGGVTLELYYMKKPEKPIFD